MHPPYGNAGVIALHQPLGDSLAARICSTPHVMPSNSHWKKVTLPAPEVKRGCGLIGVERDVSTKITPRLLPCRYPNSVVSSATSAKLLL